MSYSWNKFKWTWLDCWQHSSLHSCIGTHVFRWICQFALAWNSIHPWLQPQWCCWDECIAIKDWCGRVLAFSKQIIWDFLPAIQFCKVDTPLLSTKEMFCPSLNIAFIRYLVRNFHSAQPKRAVETLLLQLPKWAWITLLLKISLLYTGLNSLRLWQSNLQSLYLVNSKKAKKLYLRFKPA